MVKVSSESSKKLKLSIVLCTLFKFGLDLSVQFLEIIVDNVNDKC